MQRVVLASFFAAAALLSARPAHAEKVVYEASRWNHARDFIWTDQLVIDDAGQMTTRRVPGGVVGDIGMVQFHVEHGAEKSARFLRSSSSTSGVQLRWEKSCVYITPDAAGTTHVEGDQETQVLEAVLQHWESTTGPCSYLSFVVDAPADSETKYDGKNVVKYREQTWCRPGSGTDDDPPQCYSASAAAITTVFYVNAPGKPTDGLIRDADIEMNAVNFAIGVCSAPGACTTSGPPGTISDAANTLTHEVGHLLGMDHTCWDKPGDAPADDMGVPVPNCFAGALPPEVTEATMYNFQESGEVKKATIEQDDLDGVCDAYPTADDPEVCERALEKDKSFCECAVHPAGGTPWTAWWPLGALIFVTLARRRRPS